MNVYTFSNCTKQLKSKSSSYELTFLTWGIHRSSPRSLRESHRMTKPPPGVEEEEPPGVPKEEEPPPTSSRSHSMKPPRGAREEWCSGGWSFPLSADVRNEERCGGGSSFSPSSAKKEEWCSSREKRTYRSRSCLFTSSECLLIIVALINVKK
jgi:hypothetical protein